VSRFHRFMGTPLGVTLLLLATVAWTWIVLGWDAAWRLLVLLAALGLADLAIGWGRGRTFSQEVNRSWHRDPRRYWFWLVGIGAGLVLLHLHFTGV